jgi:lysozyme
VTPKRAGIGLLALVALAIAAWLFAINWAPSRTRYPQQGIDVSRHQGLIDWQKVAGQRIDFAYVKASEGGDQKDWRFDENWRGAGQAGIARGAYHYFTLCTPGDVQAANFIAAVPDDAKMLPPAVDLEFGGNCAARPTPETLITELMVFIRRVEEHYHRPVTLYLTREFDAGYQVSAKVPRKLWLRSLVWEPGWGARPWSMWQASSFHRVAGIGGRVDWNVARP